MNMLPIFLLARLLLPTEHYDVRVFSVSAYTNMCVPANNGLTASGQRTRPGIAACGPGLAFGTRILLETGQVVECWDRGGAITDGHLDVWLPLDADGTEGTALRMGRREMVGVIIS